MTHSRPVDHAAWRIAFDVAPVRAHPAGVGIYVASLARELSALLGRRLVMIGRRPEADLAVLDAATNASDGFRGGHYHAWLQLHAPRAVRRRHADLVHFTNAAAPLLPGRPYVLTVHDLSVLRMPRSHPWARVATLPVSLLAMRRARQLIVPSRATADELAGGLGVDRDRITVVHHAPSPPGRLPTQSPGDLLARLGLRREGYLLATGTIEPRKNHLRLVEAFERLVAAGHDLRLVISGELGWYAEGLLRRIAASPVAERIVRTGYLPPGDLDSLIAASAAVCYVSLYEGYGLPVIEAMAVGAPVITSSVSSLPEVAGDAAVLVDPHDSAAIAAGIEEALGRRDELIAAGRARAAQRSWADVAHETLADYRHALES